MGTAGPGGVVTRPTAPHFQPMRIAIAWLLLAALDTAFATLSDGAAAGWRARGVYEGAWALTWAAITLGLGAWRRWLGGFVARDWPLAGRLAAHAVALVAAGVLDAAVRRAVSGALSAPPRVPFGATLLYFADVT